MADENDPEDDDSDDEDEAEGGAEHLQQEFQFSPVSARVPERVARGVFSTGAIVLQGPDEFVIDFILKLSHPSQVVSRIVLPTQVIPRFIGALEANLKIYADNFGGLPQMPTPKDPVGDRPPDSIEELYEQLKLPDEMLGGVYANAVMIGHAPAEFCFDFITNIYPRSVVAARVFLSAPQVPALYDVLVRTWRKFLESRGDELIGDDDDDDDDEETGDENEDGDDAAN